MACRHTAAARVYLPARYSYKRIEYLYMVFLRNVDESSSTNRIRHALPVSRIYWPQNQVSHAICTGVRLNGPHKSWSHPNKEHQ